MKPHIRAVLAALAASLAIPGAQATEGMRIGWQDLLPPGSSASATQKIASRPKPQNTDVALTTALDGEIVEISGYLLPADREGDLVYAFMLVPRRGACSHMRQPPAAQVVRVVPEKPYRLSMNYEPVTVSGRLGVGLEKTQLFILDGVAVIESGYRLSAARVFRTAMESGTSPSRTPWGFLKGAPGG